MVKYDKETAYKLIEAGKKVYVVFWGKLGTYTTISFSTKPEAIEEYDRLCKKMHSHMGLFIYRCEHERCVKIYTSLKLPTDPPDVIQRDVANKTKLRAKSYRDNSYFVKPFAKKEHQTYRWEWDGPGKAYTATGKFCTKRK